MLRLVASPLERFIRFRASQHELAFETTSLRDRSLGNTVARSRST